MMLTHSVCDAKKNPGKAYPFRLTFQPDEGAHLNALAKWTGEGIVSGTLTAEDGYIAVSGTLTVPAEAPCDLCLKPTAFTVQSDFSALFYPQPRPGEPDAHLYTGNEVDLAPLILENLAFAYPSALRCGRSCKGLCPICGGNRNEMRCACTQDEPEKENPFAVLKGKFK